MPLGEFSEEDIQAQAQYLYEEAQARFEVDAGRTALLVIDMTDEFVRPHWSPYWVPEATRQVPRIRSLIATFHRLHWPVVFTADEDRLRGLNNPEVVWLVPAGERMSQYPELFAKALIYDALGASDEDILVLKHGYGAFFQTPLDTVLRRRGVTTLVICGTMTNICCGTTAREAFAHGYRVIFGADVNSTDHQDLHMAELRTLRCAFARIMTADEIEDSIRRAMSGVEETARA
jgi:nicotinamidase-related amidase